MGTYLDDVAAHLEDDHLLHTQVLLHEVHALRAVAVDERVVVLAI